MLPTDSNEYYIPALDLPEQWKYAVNTKGQIYYYHTKISIPQWEPPIKLLPLMDEQRLPDVDLKLCNANSLNATDEDTDVKNDSDEEDEDVVNILSNSQMNTNLLLHLKSDPILEKYNDDDLSSTSSEDEEQQELERQLSFLTRKTEECWSKLFNIQYLKKKRRIIDNF